MAFSWGGVLTTAARSRTAMRQGQREAEAERAALERQRSLDLFNEYAKRRQMGHEDSVLQQRAELQTERLTNATNLRKMQDEAAAENLS